MTSNLINISTLIFVGFYTQSVFVKTHMQSSYACARTLQLGKADEWIVKRDCVSAPKCQCLLISASIPKIRMSARMSAMNIRISHAVVFAVISNQLTSLDTGFIFFQRKLAQICRLPLSTTSF